MSGFTELICCKGWRVPSCVPVLTGRVARQPLAITHPRMSSDADPTPTTSMPV